MAYNMGDATGYIKLNIQDFKNKYNEVHGDTEKLENLFGGLGSIFDKTGKDMAASLSAVAAKIAGFALSINTVVDTFKSVVSVGSSFQSAMSQVAATMGMSADEIANNSEEYKKLADAAKDAGNSTRFSATQASEALNFLALSGMSANEAISTLPDVLNLAAAGNLDLAYSADVLTDAMSALGLPLEETSSFVDKLAKTAQSSNTSVGQLGEAILTVGGTAKSLSGGVDELNTALGILANNGIKASEGGTALRQIILNLTAPTDKAREAMDKFNFSAYDLATGAMKPLNETFAELDEILSNMATQEERDNFLATIFDARQLKSAQALLSGYNESWDELYDKIENADGAASRMAETMQENLAGAATIAKSALEGVQVTAFEALEHGLTNGVKVATEAINNLNKTLQTPEMQKALEKIGKMLGDILSVFAEFLANQAIPKMIKWFSELDTAAENLKAVLAGIGVALPIVATGLIACNTSVQAYILKMIAAKAATAAFTHELLANPFTAVAVALAALVAGIVQYIEHQKNLIKAAQEQETEMSKAADAARDNAAALEEYRLKAAEIGDARTDEINELRAATNALGEYANKTNLTADELATAQSIIDKLNELYPENTAHIENGQVVAYDKLAESVANYTDKLYYARQLEANQEKYFSAREIVEETTKALEGSDQAIDDAQKNLDKWVKIADEYAHKGTLSDEMEWYEVSQGARTAGESVASFIAIQKKAADEDVKRAKIAQETNHETLEKAQKDMNEAEHDMLSLRIKAGEQVDGFYANQQEAYIAQQQNYINQRQQQEREAHKDEIAAIEKAAADKEAAYNKMWEDIDKLDRDWQLRKITNEDEYQKLRKEKLESNRNEDDDKWVKEYNKSLVYQENLFKKSEDEKTKALEKEAAEREKIRQQEIANQERSAQKEFQAWQNSYNKVVDDATNAYNQIQKNQESVIRSLTGNIKLYDTESQKVWDKASKSYKEQQKLIVDPKAMEAQADATEDYIKILGELQDKIPDSLMADIYAMDKEKGAEYAKALSEMSDKELKTYVDNYSRIYEASKTFSEQLYSNQIESFKKNYADRFDAVFEDVPGNLKLVGQDSIDGFIEGIESKNEAAQGTLKDLMDDVLERTRNVLDIHSPSGKYKEMGENSLDGFVLGFSDKSKWQNIVDSFKSWGESSGNSFVNGFKSVWDSFANSFKAAPNSMSMISDISTSWNKPNVSGYMAQAPVQSGYQQSTQQAIVYQNAEYGTQSLSRQDIISAIKEAMPSGNVILQADGRQLGLIARKELNMIGAESGNLNLRN